MVLMIEEDSHFTFTLDLKRPEFPKQRIVVVYKNDKINELETQYPGAAFWGKKAFWALVDYLAETVEDYKARAFIFAQYNALKIEFGPLGIKLLLTDKKLKRQCMDDGINYGTFRRIERRMMETGKDD